MIEERTGFCGSKAAATETKSHAKTEWFQDLLNHQMNTINMTKRCGKLTKLIADMKKLEAKLIYC